MISIYDAYKEIHGLNLVIAMQGLVTGLALFLIIWKIIRKYDENVTQKDREGNIKLIFDNIKLYAKYMLFIALFPFVIPGLEYVLNEMQKGLLNSIESPISGAMMDAFAEWTNKYIVDNTDKHWWNPLWIVDYLGAAALQSVLFYLYKSMYYFFCAGRYMWLIMLELVAPIAIVCAMDEKTSQVFHTWVKHMVICFLLMPFYAMADIFSDVISKYMFDELTFNAYGIVGILIILFLKFSLFSVVTKRMLNLL